MRKSKKIKCDPVDSYMLLNLVGLITVFNSATLGSIHHLVRFVSGRFWILGNKSIFLIPVPHFIFVPSFCIGAILFDRWILRTYMDCRTPQRIERTSNVMVPGVRRDPAIIHRSALNWSIFIWSIFITVADPRGSALNSFAGAVVKILHKSNFV